MGRGSSGRGNTVGGGLNPANIKNQRDLVSEREGKQTEVDDVLTVARDVYDQYGVEVGTFELSDIGGKDANTLAYTDGTNMGFNRKYFDGEKMTNVYDDCVAAGYHPGRGNKSGIEAVASHEDGHLLAAMIAKRYGYGGVHHASEVVVDRAMAGGKYRSFKAFAGNISGYAKANKAECVAEAFADVYCNGDGAKAESKAVMTVVNNMLRK